MHFGGHPEDLTSIRRVPGSDTLFGALTWAVQMTDGEGAAGAWVERFRTPTPPLLISSALPYFGGVAFVPRPQRRLPTEYDVTSADGWDPKVLKRTEYIDLALLRLWSSGFPGAHPTALGEVLVSGEHAALFEKSRTIWKTSSRPGVVLDRRTSASQVYSTLSTWYACSLAVYVLAESEADLEHLERLLVVLGRTGIGGRRSRGLGAFACRRIPSPLPLTAEPKGLVLSLVWPRTEELASGILSPPEGRGYRVLERRAWVSSPPWSTERARTVAMIGEGSYLNPRLVPCVGGMVDTTPHEPAGRHPVLRYGLGLFLDEDRLQ